jgi:hypothetical protein
LMQLFYCLRSGLIRQTGARGVVRIRSERLKRRAPAVHWERFMILEAPRGD